MKQEMTGGSGISWAICKSYASRSRKITTPVPHYSVFAGWMDAELSRYDYTQTCIITTLYLPPDYFCAFCFNTVGWAAGRASGL